MSMYELWLALNIVYELALAHMSTLIILAVTILFLFGIAAVKGAPAWGKGFRIGLAGGVLVTIAGFFFVPAMIDSSIGDLNYWVDWANLLAVAAGFGAAAAALLWPIGAMFASPD